MVKTQQQALRIAPLRWRQREIFHRLPWRLYRHDPHWRPPLLLDRRRMLSKRRAAMRHIEWQGWLLFDGTEAVGRIGAQINHAHLRQHDDASGFFSLFELDAQYHSAAPMLFDVAEQWLRARGMRQVLGPFNLSINEEAGLLVEGFEQPPVIMTGHAQPWYDAALHECGYDKATDLLAYLVDAQQPFPAGLKRLTALAQRKVTLRAPDPRKLSRRDLDTLRELFNNAWSRNWGFVPFEAREFAEMGREMALLLPKGFVQIATLNGEDAAMLVVLPDLNELIRDLDGCLWPMGWWRLLRRLRRGQFSSGRVALMGVRHDHQHSMIGAALALSVIGAAREAVLAHGMQRIELSWILEDNRPMRNIIESAEGQLYKRYRVYRKVLST